MFSAILDVKTDRVVASQKMIATAELSLKKKKACSAA